MGSFVSGALVQLDILPISIFTFTTHKSSYDHFLITLHPVAQWLCSRALATGRIISLARKPNFADYLRDARIRRRLSVAEVAEQVGVTAASIYFWERDHCRPRDANLSALCKVLKLPVKATRDMAAA